MIETFRHLYRIFLHQLFLAGSDDEGIFNVYKKMDLKEAFAITYDAWALVSRITLFQTWKKLWPPAVMHTGSSDDGEDNKAEVSMLR